MSALLAHEVRTILHAIRRRPLVPMLAIAILALAIGANVAVFTVLSRTLLRPLRYRDASRLVQIPMSHIEPDRTETRNSSNAIEVVQWKARATMFAGIEAARQLPATLTGTGDPESVDGADVTGGLFRLLGVAPAIGRDFAKNEDVPNATVAILSCGLWQRRFASDRTIVGKPITVNGRRLEVIGVMPRDFEVPTVSADVFVPAGLSPSNMSPPKSWNFTAFGRLRDGVSPKQGEADLRRIAGQLQREYPDTEKDKSASVQTLRKAMFGDRRAALFVLWAAVMLVQILACVNVANLLFARISDQRGAAALRLVLGADRLQMLRLRLLEGAIISAAGTIVGFTGGSIALRLLVANQPDLATAAERAWTMPLFLIATALATALVISIVPAFSESGVKLSTVLNEGSLRASSSVRGSRAREWFIICQIALAIPLLLAATAAVEHFRALQRTDIGFDPDHVLTGQLVLPERYDKVARAAFGRELVQRIAAIPGVSSAAITTNLFTAGNSAGTFAFTDRYPEQLSMAFRRITPDYFKTMRISLLSGQNFTAQDTLDSPPVAIVSESLARRYWPGENPIGKRIRRTPPNPWMTIVGVAPDVRDSGVGVELGPTLYVPFLQNNGIYVSLVTRTAGDPRSVRDAVRRAVWSLDRNLAPAAETPLRDLVRVTMNGDRLQVALLTSFAIIAVMLATIGIYGVTTYAVSQRTREIGVRIAFGATPNTIVLEVMSRTMRSILIGVACGLTMTIAAQRVSSFVAYGAATFDPRTATAIAVLLLITSLVASLVPALQSRSVHPNVLLRDA